MSQNGSGTPTENGHETNQQDSPNSSSAAPPTASSSTENTLHHRNISSPTDTPGSTGDTIPHSTYMVPHHDYFEQLHQWIWAYQWYKLCWEQQQREIRDRMYWYQWSSTANASRLGLSNLPLGHRPAGNVPPQQGGPQGANAPQRIAQVFVGAIGPNNQMDPTWKGFRMAPIWKRVTAEIIDILILMLIKIFLTYTLFDEFLDFQKYQQLVDSETDFSAEVALELATELAVMEMAHRLISCLYEVVMTVRGFQNAGATYGKRFMGLRIITCSEFILLDGVILVKPGDIPSLKQATLRAFLKNYSWAMFVPLCLTALLNREKRAMYDSVSKCIVVEVGEPLIRRF